MSWLERPAHWQLPRALDESAPLAALTAQLQAAEAQGKREEAARLAGSLARQLAKRRWELREALGLAERSLLRVADQDLAMDLAQQWAQVAELKRAAELLLSVRDSQAEEARAALSLQVARWFAQVGEARSAWQALAEEAALRALPVEAEELRGALGFWAPVNREEAVQAYLNAARSRQEQGEGERALENHLRAFEVAPESQVTATALAELLREQGRAEAAEEVLRVHFRQGSAALRLAHAQRRFLQTAQEQSWAQALAWAFEAELDVELDAERLEELLTSLTAPSVCDFEGLLVRLAQEPGANQQLFVDWLCFLVDAHVSEWGAERVAKLRSLCAERFTSCPLPEPTRLFDEEEWEALQRRFLTCQEESQRAPLRRELAGQKLARGEFFDALNWLEPLLTEQGMDHQSAVWVTFLSGRARDPVARARALVQLAQTLPGELGGELAAFASESLLALGLSTEARGAARLSHSGGEPQESSRWAQLAGTAPEGASGAAFDQAALVIVRAETCAILARAAWDRGAKRWALLWLGRAVALRPGDVRVLRAYLQQACAAEDTSHLQKALQVALEAPVPLVALAEEVAQALLLCAQLKLPELGALTRCWLQKLAHEPSVSQALEMIAEQTQDFGLFARLYEIRLLRATREERGELYVKLAEARVRAEHWVAAARVLRRAGLFGVEPARLLPLVQSVQSRENLEGDGRLALSDLLVEWGKTQKSSSERSELLWRAGALRWDLAQDEPGAIQMWLRAVDEDLAGGVPRFAATLAAFAGVEEASAQLLQAAQETENPERSGSFFGEAARLAWQRSQRAETFRLAKLALLRAPRLTEYLTLFEQTVPEGALWELDAMYEHLADSAWGNYGERAVRYRAARQLERRGELEEAFRHALQAFAAVPAEGVTFVQMVRLGDRLQKTEAVAALLRRVAERVEIPSERERWLSKATSLCDPELVGKRERVDILLRSLSVRPDEATLRALRESLEDLFSTAPEERLRFHQQFTALVEDVLLQTSGSYGALLAIHLAVVALLPFQDEILAFSCLRRAARADLEITEYEDLEESLSKWVVHEELWRELTELVLRLIDEEGAPFGRAILTWLARGAEELDQLERAAELLVRASLAEPSESELYERARAAAERVGRRDLLESLEDFLPLSERARSLLTRLPQLSLEESLDALLEIDLDAVEEPLRIELLEVLGECQEKIGRLADARDTFQEILALDPQREQTLRGLERLAEREQDHEELARVLRLRAEAAADSEDARRLQLRRAVVLETQLGRAVEARGVLSELLEKVGDSWAVLRVLADSWERSADPARAAELWLRARAVAPDVESVQDVSYRAARAYWEAAEPRRAKEILASLEPVTAEVLELRLAVERALGDRLAIAEALFDLATHRKEEPAQVEKWFCEAAERFLQQGDLKRAERAAEEALATGQASPKARLLACQLRVRREGLTTQEQAERVVSELRVLAPHESPAEREVRLYLQTSAREVLFGKEKVRAEWGQAVADQEAGVLLSVAWAERCAEESPEKALELYEMSVGGELFHLKQSGELLLQAAQLARRLQKWERAQAFLTAIADEDPLRDSANEELTQIQLEMGKARSEEELPQAPRAQEVQSSGPRGLILQEEVGQVRRMESVPRPLALRKTTEAARALPEEQEESPASEVSLAKALESGDWEAGWALLQRFESDRSRSRDAVLVASHLAALAPGNHEILHRLVQLAERDGNEAYAAAIRHLLGAFGEGVELAAPPWEALVEQPEALRSVLYKGIRPNGLEILALVWEHATPLLKKEMAHYGLSGVERVALHTATPLGHAYRQASRLFGSSRVPVFRGTPGEGISLAIALSAPPAVIVSGTVEELTTEFCFHLGAMWEATNPEHALLYGLEPAEMRDCWTAIAFAFGPSDRRPQGSKETTRLAGLLWETIPARVQRRLSQLCATKTASSLPSVADQSRRVLRRAGLLLSGDVKTAVMDACFEAALPVPQTLEELASSVRSSPLVADLVALALSPEFAELRFRTSH